MYNNCRTSLTCNLDKKSYINYNVNVYTIEKFSLENPQEWDNLMQRCPDSAAFHSIAWMDSLNSSFKQLTPIYLLIKQDETIIGGIPSFVFEPIPGIKLWNSMPWNLVGGPQIVNSVKTNTTSLISTMNEYISSISRANGWCELYWTLSGTYFDKNKNPLTEMGYECTERFTHILNTNTSIDSIWNAYNKRVRGAVRKAEKSGVEVRDTDNPEDLKTFYDMYIKTIKRLGGTPKPLTLMQSLLKNGIANLAIATYSDTIIAGLLYLYFNKTVTLWCEASIPEYLNYRPNNAIFHHIIQLACREGYEQVDFGASPPDNEGLIAHKEQYRAIKTDFYSYTKVISPFKKSVWNYSENTLRKIYAWMQ